MIADAKAGTEYGLRAIADAPKIEDRFRFYQDAYQELGTERQHGMSLGPIPGSAIRDWCVDHELDPLETDAFKYVIRAVDNHERAAHAQKQQDEQAKAKSKARR